MNRAHSLLEVKAVDEVDGFYVISGTATTPSPDRALDVVEPMGARFAKEIPLLWIHQHDKPVGIASFGKPTKSGIPFTARLPIIKEAGILKDRVDEAIHSIRYKLIAAVSIGFRVLNNAYEVLKDGGIRFLETEIMELSLCVIPMNADAKISGYKSMSEDDQRDALLTLVRSQDQIKPNDSKLPAALGTPQFRVVKMQTLSGVPASTKPKLKPLEAKLMNIAEQLKGFKETRSALFTEMNDMVEKSGAEGYTPDAAEDVKLDELEAKIETVDKHIERLEKMAVLNAKTAAPIDDQSKMQRRLVPSVKGAEKLEPGIAFARYALCLTASKGNHSVAAKLAERHYPQTEGIVKTLKMQSEGFDLASALRQKASVAAGTTTDSTWAGPLAEPAAFMGDFIDFLRPRTLIGQAQFEPIPFNVRIGGATSGGTAGWVGQGKAKPVTKFDFNDTTSQFTKVAAIAVITQELARFNDMAAETRIRNLLAGCVIARVDADLFDPDLAAVSAVNPGGLLNGVSPVAGPASLDPDLVRAALLRLWAPWNSTHLGTRPAYYTTPGVARALAFARESLGTPAFPGVTPNGGTLDGIPLRTSQYLAHNGGSGGAPFILVDEAEIYLADDGSVTLDARDDVAVEMDSAPSSNSGTPTGASLVSMWQTNSIAFRAERFIWWAARRSGAVQWIDGFPVA
jgi:HK97 family phage major capsid protein/HK97 family phage prohead protease